MGLLDSVLSTALGQLGGQQGANPLIQMAGSLLSNNSPVGGLPGLVQQFEQAGMGHVVQSWISNGANLPVSADQLTQVLGSGPMQQMAQSLGMNPQQLGGALAQVLPHIVNHMTPGGQVPAGGIPDAGSLLASLLK
jgi:uncharacterized protein YidB (DUF937 family)